MGLAVGFVVLGGLTLFSLSRAVSWISSPDLIGKTVPVGNRGSVTGIAASLGGLAAIGAGAGPVVLATLVSGCSLLWLEPAPCHRTGRASVLGGAVRWSGHDCRVIPADRGATPRFAGSSWRGLDRGHCVELTTGGVLCLPR
jgi:hypothetical protein